VNVVTWNKAYSVYARPTLLRHETFLLQEMNDYYGGLFAKYSARGWRLKTDLGIDDKQTLKSLGHQRGPRCRQVGDEFTWTLPLDITGVRYSTTQDFVIENSFFDIEPKSSYGLYEITCNIFHANVLTYRYTSCYGSTSQDTGKVMDERTWLNLHKLFLAERAKIFPGSHGVLADDARSTVSARKRDQQAERLGLFQRQVSKSVRALPQAA